MTDIKPQAHATLSASGAERWMACPGSIQLSEGLPDTESMFAFEGTCAHYLAELCLKSDQHPSDFIDNVVELEEHDQSKEFGSEFTVTDEMAAYVAEYVDYCRALPGEHFVEQRLDYSRWVPEGFGTGDHLAFDHEAGTLFVTDLKYGKGVVKYAKDNPQAMLYGLGAYDNMSWMGEVKKVVMVIHQPRLNHIDEYTISVKALLKFGEEAREAALLTQAENPPLNAGETQCKFCKVKFSPLGCDALEKHLFAEALDGFDPIESDEDINDVKPVEEVNTSKLARILFKKKMLEDWLQSIDKRAMDLCMAGDPPAGIKLVKGRKPNKSWNIEETAILSKLKRVAGIPATKMYTQKVITPTQAAKILPADSRLLKKYVDDHKGEGKPTMVAVDDKRPTYDPLGQVLDNFD